MEEDIDRFLYGDESIRLQEPSVDMKNNDPQADQQEVDVDDNLTNEEEEDEFDVVIGGDGSSEQTPSNKKPQSTASIITPATMLTASSKIDLNAIPQFNGQSIYEIDLDSFEEKPWKKPGTDINDYFNYGFSETTWRLYCQKQQQLRAENKKINVLDSSNVPQGGGGLMMPPIPIPTVAGGFKLPPLPPLPPHLFMASAASQGITHPSSYHSHHVHNKKRKSSSRSRSRSPRRPSSRRDDSDDREMRSHRDNEDKDGRGGSRKESKDTISRHYRDEDNYRERRHRDDEDKDSKSRRAEGIKSRKSDYEKEKYYLDDDKDSKSSSTRYHGTSHVTDRHHPSHANRSPSPVRGSSSNRRK